MKGLREQFADTMLDIGRQNDDLVVMVGDISHGILQPFAQACPGRYFNIGICEPAMVSIAAGMAKQGLIPVTHTIAPFLIERSFEQIKLDFGYQGFAGNFISVGGAFDYAQLGCSHHCYADVSLMSHIPNSQVFCPGSATEFDELFRAQYNSGKINYFKLTENPHGVEFEQPIEAGKIIQVTEGSDISVIVLGPQLKNAIEATKELSEKHGVNVDLLYVHSVKPFDSARVIDSLSRTGRALVVEELSAQDGIYNLVMRSWNSRDRADIRQLAIDDFVHEYGEYSTLCEVSGLTASNIVKTAIETLSNAQR
ncbi:transketolase C-terminal domain-containing protein [Aliiglaciecola sp. LCG003]|uniref:transketolase family protein n=1 Tax=Aliiglaciecola sp. LCG003 TaxID=3053655 RepID=UPI002572473E|nr:transketolase C-terminal domain-containing protein [Aliiglaciecola sp. LCG003]WJG10593.1 transketolase C-terminal domain-containing protein [Aliiglaciecola sp. LCG003]